METFTLSDKQAKYMRHKYPDLLYLLKTSSQQSKLVESQTVCPSLDLQYLKERIAYLESTNKELLGMITTQQGTRLCHSTTYALDAWLRPVICRPQEIPKSTQPESFERSCENYRNYSGNYCSACHNMYLWELKQSERDCKGCKFFGVSLCLHPQPLCTNQQYWEPKEPERSCNTCYSQSGCKIGSCHYTNCGPDNGCFLHYLSKED